MEILSYFKKCFELAGKGSFQHALNWAPILGVGLLGASLQYLGIKMFLGNEWQDVVWAGVIYTVIAWTTIFLFRLLLIAPYSLYKQQKCRIEELEKLPSNYDKKLSDTLKALYIEGEQIRKIEVKNKEDFEKIKTEVSAWYRKVSGFLEQTIPDLRWNFVNAQPEEAVEGRFVFLNAKLKGLGTIIIEYDKRASGNK